MDFALLLLRMVVGLLFVGHGTQKLFGWFGGPGIEGATKFMSSLGYRPAREHAVAAGLTELAGGALLAVGLLTPLASAAIIGVMVNAIATVHGSKGLWVTQGGYEYNLVLIVAALVPAITGAGYWSFDDAAGWDLNGAGWGVLSLLLGCGAATLVLSSRRLEAATAGAEVDLREQELDEQAEHAAHAVRRAA